MDTDTAMTRTARNEGTRRAHAVPSGTAEEPARAAAALLAGLAVLALSSPAHAQAAQGLGLEVTAGYQTLSGDDFEGLDDAVAFETVGSYAWTNGWEAGIGAGIASHDVSQNGLLVGGGAGLEYWLSDEVGLLGAATLDYLSYGEPDDVVGGTDASGLGLRVRGGLKVRFPSR